jgi:phosphohistidine phosphatase SixA
MRTLTLILILTGAAPAAEVVFVVRHAEKLDSSADPPLSKAGETRAQTLATQLADAGITAIFVTQYRRAAKTAEPLAKKLGLKPEVVPSGDVSTLVNKLKAQKGRALVVGHVDTLPKILAALGGPTMTLAEADYDNLFIWTKGELIRLHY